MRYFRTVRFLSSLENRTNEMIAVLKPTKIKLADQNNIMIISIDWRCLLFAHYEHYE